MTQESQFVPPPPPPHPSAPPPPPPPGPPSDVLPGMPQAPPVNPQFQAPPGPPPGGDPTMGIAPPPGVAYANVTPVGDPGAQPQYQQYPAPSSVAPQSQVGSEAPSPGSLEAGSMAQSQGGDVKDTPGNESDTSDANIMMLYGALIGFFLGLWGLFFLCCVCCCDWVPRMQQNSFLKQKWLIGFAIGVVVDYALWILLVIIIRAVRS